MPGPNVDNASRRTREPKVFLQRAVARRPARRALHREYAVGRGYQGPGGVFGRDMVSARLSRTRLGVDHAAAVAGDGVIAMEHGFHVQPRVETARREESGSRLWLSARRFFRR